MEGFSRILWGIVPDLTGGGTKELWADCLQGILNGTDPEHDQYWGEVGDYDQRLVEMAVLGLALCLIPEIIWEPLNERERQHLYRWLNQMNSHPCHDCNWLFFNVMVNMGFYKIGEPYDKEQMERNLRRIEEFDLGGGWYSDGIGGHSDYYVPFAMHYYGLVYAKLMEQEDPERCSRLKQRALEFAADFIHWFSPDGSAIAYGRSMTYRFAQAAFWSALAYAGAYNETFTPGVVKGLVLRNLRWWFSKPIFDAGGILTVGYAYPNLIMAENYNSPGSPYWALKTFLNPSDRRKGTLLAARGAGAAKPSTAILEPGTHLLISAVYGQAGEAEMTELAEALEALGVRIGDGKAAVTLANGEILNIS